MVSQKTSDINLVQEVILINKDVQIQPGRPARCQVEAVWRGRLAWVVQTGVVPMTEGGSQQSPPLSSGTQWETEALQTQKQM